MYEALLQIVKRLGGLPVVCGELVSKRAEVSDKLQKCLDAAKEFEVRVAGAVVSDLDAEGRVRFPNEHARAAEILKRMQADDNYKVTFAYSEKLRDELRELDALIEETGRRHSSDSNMVNLVASLLNAGLKEDAETVLQAYAPAEAPAAVTASSEITEQDADAGKKAAVVETAIFTVLEVGPGKKEGTIRAFAEGPDGRVGLFARNGVGAALTEAVGMKVEVKFRRLEYGLYATGIKLVA